MLYIVSTLFLLVIAFMVFREKNTVKKSSKVSIAEIKKMLFEEHGGYRVFSVLMVKPKNLPRDIRKDQKAVKKDIKLFLDFMSKERAKDFKQLSRGNYFEVSENFDHEYFKWRSLKRPSTLQEYEQRLEEKHKLSLEKILKLQIRHLPRKKNENLLTKVSDFVQSFGKAGIEKYLFFKSRKYQGDVISLSKNFMGVVLFCAMLMTAFSPFCLGAVSIGWGISLLLYFGFAVWAIRLSNRKEKLKKEEIVQAKQNLLQDFLAWAK